MSPPPPSPATFVANSLCALPSVMVRESSLVNREYAQKIRPRAVSKGKTTNLKALPPTPIPTGKKFPAANLASYIRTREDIQASEFRHRSNKKSEVGVLNKVAENSRCNAGPTKNISNSVIIRKKLRCLVFQNAKAVTQNFKEHEEPNKSHHQKIRIYNNRTKHMDIMIYLIKNSE